MALVYLGLGSNLGQKEEFLELAIIEIEKQIGSLVARSAFYESEPWGFDSPNAFINACVAVQTTLSPNECLNSIAGIETSLGRTKRPSEAYTDRVIDIDILFYDQLILQEDQLTIPHPLLHLRKFVLNPLVEIAPKLMHPIFNKSISKLLKDLN